MLCVVTGLEVSCILLVGGWLSRRRRRIVEFLVF